MLCERRKDKFIYYGQCIQINCEFVDLGIHESFEAICFGFAFLKAWQHATIDEKMSYSF
jgi:hypothetical protein